MSDEQQRSPSWPSLDIHIDVQPVLLDEERKRYNLSGLSQKPLTISGQFDLVNWDVIRPLLQEIAEAVRKNPHDGRLGNGLRVHFDDNLVNPNDLGSTESYKGVRITAPYGYMPLTPEQFLSLLVWGEQQRETLVKMVKEREEAK